MDVLPICRKIKCPHCPNNEMWQYEPSDTNGFEVECPVCRTRSKFTVDGYRMYSYRYFDPYRKHIDVAIHQYVVN